MKVKKKITAMALALTMVFAMVPLMGAENSYAMVDAGEFIVDLTGGSVTYESVDYNKIGPAITSMHALGIEDKSISMSFSEDMTIMYLDLDRDGSTDVSISQNPTQTPGTPPEMTLEAAETRSVVGKLNLTITEEQVGTSMEKQMRETAPPDMTPEELDAAIADMKGYITFASTVTFIIPPKAKTLTLKGKTVKIKAKKLKKKKKTYAISKFLTVSKAQGTVTYAKVSGNKKIKIASNGKVTLKKKLKKGKYKVTVKVTAAGNNMYQPVTKNATFKIKVK